MKITLRNKITVLKILTAITFLFVTIPGNIWIPMWWGLLMSMSYLKCFQGIMSLLIAGSVFYIFISAAGFSRMNQRLTIIAIAILYFPIVVIFILDFNDFKHNGFIPPLTYIIFITVSLLAIALMIQKRKMDKSTQQKRNGFLNVTK